MTATEGVPMVLCSEELDYAHYCNGEMQWFGVNVRPLPLNAVANTSPRACMVLDDETASLPVIARHLGSQWRGSSWIVRQHGLSL